jgi:hypothetical protein
MSHNHGLVEGTIKHVCPYGKECICIKVQYKCLKVFPLQAEEDVLWRNANLIDIIFIYMNPNNGNFIRI